MKVWDFSSYRDYLVAILGPEGSRSGARRDLASAIQVHTTYVSQVLKGKAEFSLEQAEAINFHFGHSEEEGEYFLLLVLKARSGTVPLRRRFEAKLKKMRDERLNIARRLKVETGIHEKDREKFYSSAIYGAAHVLCSLPHINSTNALAEALRISKSRASEIVDFLIGVGLVKSAKGQISPGQHHVHLNNQSELILKHHTNWRMHAISSLQFLDKDDLHYSAAISLSQEGAYQVKEELLKTLKRVVEVVGNSEIETACVLNFDFYKLLS